MAKVNQKIIACTYNLILHSRVLTSPLMKSLQSKMVRLKPLGQKATLIRFLEEGKAEIQLRFSEKIEAVDLLDIDMSPAPASDFIAPAYSNIFDGFFLILYPLNDNDGVLQKFDLYISSSLNLDLMVEIVLSSKTKKHWKRLTRLKNNSLTEIGALPYSDLNEKCTLVITANAEYTDGSGSSQFFESPLNPKKIFKNKIEINSLETVYRLDLLNYRKQKSQKESLSYVKKEQEHEDIILYQSVKTYELDREIDLHIENLRSDAHILDPKSILGIQLAAFDSFLEAAIISGLDRVFVIHGMGSGKLKNEIHRRLSKTSNLKSYKNEFHPKYGFGATEIIIN